MSEYMKTFDWPWSKELYEMQWQYPYVMDIAYSPETHRLDEPTMPESQQLEQQPIAPVAPPPAQQQQLPSANVPTQTSVQGQVPPMQMTTQSALSGIKPLIVPALLIVGGILLFKYFKK